MSVHGFVKGEKDNNSQALHDTPRVRCDLGLFRGQTNTASPSVVLVIQNGEVEKSTLYRELIPGSGKGVN